MGKTYRDAYRFSTDVLVIGGGLGGAWAAKTAAKQVRDVLVVDKGPRDWGGLGSMSGGDMICMQPEDDVNDLLDDLVYYYDGLCEQDVLEKILVESYDRFREYEEMGHRFARDADGRLMYIPQRGLPHMRYYFYHPYGRGGSHMAEVMAGALRKAGVRRLGRIQITDLVKEDGRVTGAVGFHVQSGVPCFFRAKAVILATNFGGWKTSYHQNSCAGDGAALAYRAGAACRNCEFIKIWNVPTQFAWEGQTGLLPKGALLLNAKGEDFMRRYAPEIGARADPHYNTHGMACEIRAGRGPIYFDTSKMKSEDVEIMRPAAGWMKLNDDKLKALGIDFFGGQTEWMTQLHISYGGVKADINGQTTVPGLFVAGRARSIDPGVYMGGWAHCTISTTGHTAGESAARFALGSDDVRFDEECAAAMLDEVYCFLGREGIRPKDVIRRMQEVTAPCDVRILKTGRGLSKAIESLEAVRDEVLPVMGAQDPHYLMKLVEARANVTLTEMTLRASLMRKESRSGHYREDFPKRSPDLRWIIVEKGADGNMSTRMEALDTSTMRIKPHKYYMDHFNFPVDPDYNWDLVL